MEKFRITALETLNIPAGNDVALLVKLVKCFEHGPENALDMVPEPWPLDVSEDVAVSVVSERGVVTAVPFTTGDGGRLLFTLLAKDVRVGLKYGIDVRGSLNGVAWHAYGQSVVKVTAATERGPQQVTAQGDPYEITLFVGYASDVVPRHLRDLDGYDTLTQLLDSMGETLAGKVSNQDVTNALRPIIDRFANYIPTSQKGQSNGVASLDAAGKILASALNMPWRGNFTGNFQASNIAPGIYGVDDRKIGPNPLNGENAHGVMLVFPDRYKTTLFLVGRPNGSQYGNAPEIYARRWLETAKSWTSWFTTANYAKKSDIPTGFRVTRFYSTEKTSGLHMPESTPYEPFVDKDGTPIVLEEGVLYVLEEDLPYGFQRGDIFYFDPTAPKQYDYGYDSDKQIGRLRCIVNKSSLYTIYEEMTEYEAKTGRNTVGKVITAAVLKSAIKEHAPAEDLSPYAKKTDLPSLRTVGASEDNIEIEAGGRKNVQIALDIPDGYTIGAYRGVGLQGTTNDAEGFHKCAIQSFSTAGGGTKANISIKNFGEAAVKVKLNVEVLLFKSSQ